MPRAFITGISGQDGGYLAESLLAGGWDVHGLVMPGDRWADHFPGLAARVTLHEGDLTDDEAVRAVVAAIEPAEIYNLAGISSVALSWQQPMLTARVTGIGAAGVFEAAWLLQQETGRPVRVVQASSSEIFGDPAESPQTERTPLRPQTPYGAAKAYAHQLASVYRGRGLHVATCILYNHESPRRPETFVTRKITKAAAMIAAGRQQTVQLGNLDARRDWGWAPDYVDAMVRAARHDVPDDFVVATGTSRSIREFVAAAFRECGIDDWQAHVAVDEQLVRPADAREQVGDATKARTVLGWRPSVTFEQMVAALVRADRDLVTASRSGA